MAASDYLAAILFLFSRRPLWPIFFRSPFGSFQHSMLVAPPTHRTLNRRKPHPRLQPHGQAIFKAVAEGDLAAEGVDDFLADGKA